MESFWIYSTNGAKSRVNRLLVVSLAHKNLNKNNLNMRTKIVSLIAAIIAISSCYSNAQVLGEVLYNWDFANGLPADWTNTSTNPIALWEYRGPNTDPNNAVCSRGSCASGSLPLNSQTLSNGFFIFDSNYWDDPGIACGEGFGSGLAPAPHDASLTTGTLNFTGYTSVVLTFQQQFRHYSTTTAVEVSLNGGTTWIVAGTNIGGTSSNVEWKTVNISSIAANQSNVKIRFRFTGIYYWWLIDDVSIYSANDNDIMLVDAGYTYNTTPDNIYNMMEYDQYPVNMLPSLRFRGKASNIGGFTQNSVVLYSTVLDASNQVVDSQNSNSVNLSAGQVTNLLSPLSFTPSSTLGDYKVALRIQQSQTDENFDNNVDTLDYSISQFTWARDEGGLEDTYNPPGLYSTEAYEIGNIYYEKTDGLE